MTTIREAALKPSLILLVLVVALTLTASLSRADVSSVIAKGGSIELTSADVRAIVATLPDDSRKAAHSNLPALEQLLRSEIAQRAIVAEARAKNFDHDPAAAKQLERVQQEALMRLWLASKATVPADYPSDAEVKAAYEAARAARPLEYHLAQIFISAPNGADSSKLSGALRKANDIAARLPSSDFAQIAREQSEHAESAPKGGDLGFVAGERLPPDVLKTVQSLTPGQVAGPLKTSEGLHFLKLIESRPITLPPLADVRGRIAADLRARRAQDLERAYVSELSGRLGISINEIELTKLQATLN
jgi:peptidylprolyl isomerase